MSPCTSLNREPTISSDNRGHQMISDAVGQQLLARAIQLDGERGSRMSIAQLRDVALEAGISLDAFEHALQDLDAGTLLPAEEAPPAPAAHRFLRRLGARILGRGTPAHDTSAPPLWSARGLVEALATNIIAFALFWVPMLLLMNFLHSAGVMHTGAIDTATIAVGTALGLLLALRLRARATLLFLAAMLAGELVSLLLDFRTAHWTPSSGATWILAGAIGTVIGFLISRRRVTTNDAALPPPPAAVDAPTSASSPGGAATTRATFLELGIASN